MDLGRRNVVPWGFVPAKFETLFPISTLTGVSSGKVSFRGGRGRESGFYCGQEAASPHGVGCIRAARGAGKGLAVGESRGGR